jgi:hypothetical protein
LRRFVYSPKVWAYVKTGNTSKSVVDISTFLVSGSINRRLNAVSTADLTIRNPYRRWTRKGAPTFHPMDPLTIYMMRAPGHPVQVFTGYLDSTPYYQMYPGTVTLRASCTLKRLLYEHFDMALPFTQQFMMQYGWVPDNKSGMMINIPAELPTLASTGYFTDSGIGSLLYATLQHIGGWDPKSIFIEKLPTGLQGKLAKLFNQYRADNQAAIKDFETLLEKYIGPGEYGGGGDTSGGGDPSTGAVQGADKIIPIMVQIADKYNVPAEMVIATALIETGLTNKDSPGNPHYGWFQWDSKTGPPGSYQGWGYTTVGPADACYDLGFATTGYCKAAAGCARKIPSVRSDWLSWTMKVQGVNGSNNPLYPQTWSAKVAAAKTLIAKFGKSASASTDASAGTSGNDSETRPIAGNTGSNDSAGKPKVYAPIAKKDWTLSRGYGMWTNTSGHGHVHSGIDVAVPGGTPCVAPYDGIVSFATTAWSDGGMVHFKFTENVGDIKKGTVIGWGHVQKIYVSAGDRVKAGETLALSGVPSGGAHVHFIQRVGDDGGGDGSVNPESLFRALQQGETTPTDGGSGSGGSGGDSGGASDPVANPKAAAFAAAFSIPSAMEMSEALMLQGRKSLMNDKPLLPFVEQLSTASLRQFQSLPDGRFFAFFPDYFGEFGHAKPYWEIRDIEILDGNINLSDDSLVTHQFVVGDTIPFGGIGLPERLLSSGVVDIYNAFNAGENPDEHPVITQFAGDEGRGAALKFLQRYGARPDYYEAPMIRSPYFELFLAWQRFMLAWSKQFSTEFTFTFMPELYPGGKVGFPDHGIKMFIEEVTHSFDYTGGFTTNATLSAPSAYGEEFPALTAGLVKDF